MEFGDRNSNDPSWLTLSPEKETILVVEREAAAREPRRDVFYTAVVLS